MPTSPAMRKAIKKYQKEKVDEIKIRVPKGKKAIIQEYASTQNESVNSFINRLIDEAMEHDESDSAAKSSKLQILTENVTEASQNILISSKKQKTQHKPFTEADQVE